MVQEMKLAEKYDKIITGVVSGAFFPLVVGLIVFAFTSHGRTLGTYLERISQAGIVIHAITLCVFPNVIIFLLFNQLDMLRAAKGVLGMTIVYAIIVFVLKLI
jgi:hypothetical protein